MTLYIKVISGYKIPPSDSTGLTDPFCVLELLNRNEKKKTLIRKQTLTPVWNQEFQFKILSFNTDIFSLSLYDYDLLGQWKLAIKDMKPGIVEDKVINAGGLIHIKYQLACANQCKWENKEYIPKMLHIRVIEAKEFQNNTGKTDPYLELFFNDDINKQRTKTLVDTLTPQWNELVNLIIPDESQDLIVEIWDKNVKVDKMICSTKLSIKQYLDQEPHFEWIKIGKVSISRL